MKRSSLFAVLVLALGMGASLLYAGAPKKAKDWKQPAWKVPKEQSDIISAVNAAKGTVSITHTGGKDKQDHDLAVNAFTEIRVNDKRATLADLKAGMHVDYTLGGDGVTAARIVTVTEQAPPPTPVPTATPSFPNAGKTAKKK